MAGQYQLEAADVTAAAPVGGRQLDGHVGHVRDLTPEEIHAARRVTASYAHGPHDLADLLAVLGLLEVS